MHASQISPNAKQLDRPVRRVGGPMLLITASSLLSLALPLVAPVVASGGAVLAFMTARRTRSGYAWTAFVVAVSVLILALVIDFALMSAASVEVRSESL